MRAVVLALVGLGRKAHALRQTTTGEGDLGFRRSSRMTPSSSKSEILCPGRQRHRMRETPWDYISYLEYRHRVELSEDDFRTDRRHRMVRFMLGSGFSRFHNALPYAVYQDSLSLPHRSRAPRALPKRRGTADSLDWHVDTRSDRRSGVPSRHRPLLLAHCTSTYPCRKEELNLRMPPRRSSSPVGVAPRSERLVV
jgi:hypothetical protein